MKKSIGMFLLVSTFGALLHGCSSVSTSDSCATHAWPVAWSNPSWTVAEEAVLAQALAIRAKWIEQKTSIHFGEEWKPKVGLLESWESVPDLGNPEIDGLYLVEEQTIYFLTSLTCYLNKSDRESFHLLDPTMLARGTYFQELADHELGHILADVVSRRIGNGPYFTVAYAKSLALEDAVGLKVLAEGIGDFFEHLHHPMKEHVSELAFPATLQELEAYEWEDIINKGGYWIVKDVLSRYGERGLIWLMTHQFTARYENMRAAAVAYRTRALTELAGP